jgi:hypothetical protein
MMLSREHHGVKRATREGIEALDHRVIGRFDDLAFFELRLFNGSMIRWLDGPMD